MRNIPKIALLACVVAFLISGLSIVSALREQIMILPFALIPLIAGLGILRRRVWSAYGFALVLVAELLLMTLVFLRAPSGGAGRLQMAPLVVFIALLLALFVFAGRSLARAGGERGWASPWIAVSVLSVAPFLFLQAFVIPTGAMEDTLLIGDRILVQSFPKTKPSHGDIVAFVYPLDRRQIFIKRVIGLPGDRIRISNKIVYRNGAALTEPYVVHKFPGADSYRDNLPGRVAHFPLEPAVQEMLATHVVGGEVVVPEGRYFVLGDNRDNSLDSRYWGFVAGTDMIGKPRLIYDSEEASSSEVGGGKPAGPHRVRWDRVFKLL